MGKYGASFTFRSDWHNAIAHYAVINLISYDEACEDLKKAVMALDFVTSVCFKSRTNVYLSFTTKSQKTASKQYDKFVEDIAKLFLAYLSDKPVERNPNG